MKTSSPIKSIFSIILALFFGSAVSGFLGFYLPAGEFFSALSIFSSLMLAFLYGFSGIVPAVVMSAAMIVTGYLTGGIGIAGYLFLIGIFPGLVMIFGSYKGYKFFAQVRNAIVAEIIAFILVLVAIRAFTGQDFAAFFRTMCDEMLSLLTEESKDAFAGYLNEVINQQYAAENVIATEDMLAFFSEGMEQTLAIAMPAALVMYSVINGAAGVLWMNWLRTRHNEKNVQYVPLSGWRLSKQITLGLIIIYIAVMIISSRAGEAGVSAQIIVLLAIICAATIQACASFLSRFRMLGLTSGKRVAFLLMLIFLSGPFITIYGILSALFGVKGLFAPRIRKIDFDASANKKNNQEDTDPSEHKDDKEDE